MNNHYGAIVQGFQNQLSSNEDLIRFENGWSQYTEPLIASWLYQVAIMLIGERNSLPTAIEPEAIPLPKFDDPCCDIY
jgi:hypothetical protein